MQDDSISRGNCTISPALWSIEDPHRTLLVENGKVRMMEEVADVNPAAKLGVGAQTLVD